MEEKNLETLGGLCSHMLSSPMPVSDDVRECLTQLCVRPTCAAYIVFGMIQKAAKGDTSAAMFIKEISGEGDSPDDAGISICIPSAMWSSAVWQGSRWRS